MVYKLDGEITYENGFSKYGPQTNNHYELYAILRAIQIGQYLDTTNITIRTDSNYAINCITKWYYKWLNNGWKTSYNNPVKNRKIIEEIHEEICVVEDMGGNVEFVPVKAHSTHPLNNMADYYAKEAAEENPLNFY